jgi:hypothetical protein
MINRNSKTTSHFSLQYLLAGPWRPERAKTVDFQKSLLDNGLDFSQTNLNANAFTLTRQQPSALQVKLESPGPQVMTIQVLAQDPQYDLELFCRDGQAACDSFQQTWPGEHYQVLKATAKVHHLYSLQSHAFKYLWEKRLGQAPSDFQILGKRPVAGGGLRLLMPPHSVDGVEPVSIEVRIESFLRETNKLFIETVFTWPKPSIINKDQRFNPEELMNSVEAFAANEVWDFVVNLPDGTQ